MLPIVSAFSSASWVFSRVSAVGIVLLVLSGCVSESEVQNGPLERLPLRQHFLLEEGEFVNDSLLPLYPNPFNLAAGDTTVKFNFWVSDTAHTIILIQNPIGEEVVRYEDSTLPPGQYRGSWAPLTNEREPLNPGLYFVTFRTEQYIFSRMLSIQTN